MEKHQLKAGLAVFHHHPIGAAAAAWRAMLAHHHLHRHRGGKISPQDRIAQLPVNAGMGQVQQHIARARNAQLAHILRGFRANAGQGFQPRKKRE